jgi:hypothetical protein
MLLAQYIIAQAATLFVVKMCHKGALSALKAWFAGRPSGKRQLGNNTKLAQTTRPPPTGQYKSVSHNTNPAMGERGQDENFGARRGVVCACYESKSCVCGEILQPDLFPRRQPAMVGKRSSNCPTASQPK